ncbi:MAG: hypothetical protein K7J47_16690 [Acidobacteria bacterium]|nr:hypothetical protein [Bryobacteraceae bacterium CoA2 C42]
MRTITLATAALGLLSTNLIAAEGPAFRTVSASQAEREISGFTSVSSTAAMWVWADKQVYRPGEQLTVRWTVKPNNDLYPYTIVAYRQNNQTGAKFYLPANNNTATDFFGNTPDQGFRIVRLPEATKATVATVTVPEEFGMHTLVVQLRDYTGTRPVKTAYFKFSVVRATVDLPAAITENRTLTADNAYSIRGIVTVRNNATLTIEPGTVIIGQPGSQPPSVLLVANNGKLVAEGTRSRPIIMTSSQPIGRRQRGDWGGLVMLGQAPINDPAGFLTIEGLPELPETRYGGTNADHSCGSLRYVRVEFAGALLRPNEETNSITWGGCGKGTKGEYLQAHYGLDDAFEWFGGTNDAKYLVGTYTADDFIDGQIGWSGRLQHGVMVANDDLSNRGIEMDNYERNFAARPLGNPTMFNLTFVGGGARGFDEADSPCLYFRRGAGGSYNNMLCHNWITRTFGGANIADSIQPNIAAGNFRVNGILSWNNGFNTTPAAPATLEGQVVADFRALLTNPLAQFLIGDTLLRRPLERSDPDFRPLTGSPVFRANWVQPPDDGFFDQWATWIGAFGDTDWTEEWASFAQEQDLQP